MILTATVARAPGIAEEDIDVMFQTNVTGLINITQAVLPIFKARPDGGAGDIINIGSIAGREPYAGGSIYCATKAAVRAFTDALRKELIDTRIRVMEVDPGQVETVGASTSPYLYLGETRVLMQPVCAGVLGRPFLRRQVKGGCRLCVSTTLPCQTQHTVTTMLTPGLHVAAATP